MLVTFDTFHASIGLLKGVEKNAELISVTFDTSHDSIGLLNIVYLNISEILVM